MVIIIFPHLYYLYEPSRISSRELALDCNDTCFIFQHPHLTFSMVVNNIHSRIAITHFA